MHSWQSHQSKGVPCSGVACPTRHRGTVQRFCKAHSCLDALKPGLLTCDLLPAASVAHLHSMGISHRDLKPENLVFDTRDASARIKVCCSSLHGKQHCACTLLPVVIKHCLCAGIHSTGSDEPTSWHTGSMQLSSVVCMQPI